MMKRLYLQDENKNKLHWIINEPKEFKFQQNLGVEFSKDGKALNEIIFVDTWLDSNKVYKYKYKCKCLWTTW